jgi:arylsulfatase A-like enzyme
MHPLPKVVLPRVLEDDLDDVPQYARDITTLKHVAPSHDWMLGSGEWKHAVQSYLASTTFVDAQVGRVLDALDQSPHAGSTIVVLFSDHGFHLGEKHHWAKRTLWDDGTRVPLIIATPGRTAGQVSDKPAELIDIFPTLLELCGLEADPAQQGHSLVPLLDEPALATWNHPAITSFGKGNTGVRTERYRYIRYVDGSEELYDHRTDAHEWHNLAARPEMRGILERHRLLIPRNQADITPGKSTGHNAYAAAGGHSGADR